MADINVSEIAYRLYKLHEPINLEEIENLVDERFNGKQMTLDSLPKEIMSMVGALIGKVRSQDYKFMIDLIQSVVNEIQKDK